MYTNSYTDSDSDFGIYRNIRNSTRRGINYDDDRNLAHEVSRPRNQITLQSSPRFTQNYDTDTRRYGTEQTFRPSIYVNSGIKTPRANRSSLFGTRYANDNSGFYESIKRDLSSNNRFRTTDIFERTSPIKNIRRSTT